MAREILEHSRPVQGVKFTSRIERERYQTVLIWTSWGCCTEGEAGNPTQPPFPRGQNDWLTDTTENITFESKNINVWESDKTRREIKGLEIVSLYRFEMFYLLQSFPAYLVQPFIDRCPLTTRLTGRNRRKRSTTNWSRNTKTSSRTSGTCRMWSRTR